MSELSADDLVAVSGKLGQMIFEDPGAGIAPRLEFFIEVALRPLDVDGAEVTPLFRANNIIVPELRSWRGLENSTQEFPWAPKPGSVHAAMLLFGVHNPADVTRVRFGAIAGDGDGVRIGVNFSPQVDFEVEADRDDLGQVELHFEMPLTIEPLRVATSLEKRCQSDAEAITAAIAGTGLVDLGDYGPLEKVPGGYAFSLG